MPLPSIRRSTIDDRAEDGGWAAPSASGELLRKEILPTLGLPRVGIARLLGVSRQAHHAVLAERAAVTRYGAAARQAVRERPRAVTCLADPATTSNGCAARKPPKSRQFRHCRLRDRTRP
jgi:hypothetical protein